MNVSIRVSSKASPDEYVLNLVQSVRSYDANSFLQFHSESRSDIILLEISYLINKQMFVFVHLSTCDSQSFDILSNDLLKKRERGEETKKKLPKTFRNIC